MTTSNRLLSGEMAPDFEARALSGERVRLSAWRGRQILLIFVQPDCVYSQAVLAAVAGVHTDLPADIPTPVVISYGREAENERVLREYGIHCAWLLQDDIEVAARYGLDGTPGSYIIDEDGRVVGPPHTGVAGVMSHLGVSPGNPLAQSGWERETSLYVPINLHLQLLMDYYRRQDSAAQSWPEGDEAQRTAEEQLPLVSVVMTTRDRPVLLPIALECYRRQTYEARELILVDDGTRWPADPEAVAEVGGRIIRVDEGMTLGAKLNRGCQDARGELCQKWDDDDWYAPRFLETLVTAYRRRKSQTGGSALAYLTFPLLFDLPRWRILPWSGDDPCSSTILFERKAWARAPFPDIKTWDDYWFLAGLLEMGTAPVPVLCGDLYAIVRHDSLDVGREHTWNEWAGGEPMHAYLRRWSGESKDPESVFPEWALSRYRDMLSGREARQEHGRLTI